MACRPHAQATPVGARSDARIVAVSPVSEIVAALMSAARMVADLVGGKAGGGRHRVGQLVQHGRRILVERLELAGGVQRCKARPGLDRQLVKRQMAGAEAESLRKRRRPAVFGVARKRVDQVEADSSEMVLCDFEGLPSLACRMRAAEEGEFLIVETLQPEREAVDSGCSEIGEAR